MDTNGNKTAYKDLRVCIILIATMVTNTLLLPHTRTGDHISCVLTANAFMACIVAVSDETFPLIQVTDTNKEKKNTLSVAPFQP